MEPQFKPGDRVRIRVDYPARHSGPRIHLGQDWLCHDRAWHFSQSGVARLWW